MKLVAPGKSCGVFGANKGTIRDLAVEGALSTEFEIAGGIVGINAGVIDGATFKGDITAAKAPRPSAASRARTRVRWSTAPTSAAR